MPADGLTQETLPQDGTWRFESSTEHWTWAVAPILRQHTLLTPLLGFDGPNPDLSSVSPAAARLDAVSTKVFTRGSVAQQQKR